jgi:hypothetical protein
MNTSTTQSSNPLSAPMNPLKPAMKIKQHRSALARIYQLLQTHNGSTSGTAKAIYQVRQILIYYSSALLIKSGSVPERQSKLKVLAKSKMYWHIVSAHTYQIREVDEKDQFTGPAFKAHEHELIRHPVKEQIDITQLLRGVRSIAWMARFSRNFKGNKIARSKRFNRLLNRI